MDRLKILLISHYWYPYNTPGSFRWIHFSEKIDIHTVLTAKKPCKGFKDTTMPQGKVKKTIRIGYKPALIWSIFVIPIAIFLSFFHNKIIITSPPEGLFILAWFLQLIKKDVYTDIRDSVKRPSSKTKKLYKIYKWFYNRLKNVCVTMKHFDDSKKVIRHGYDDIKKKSNILEKYYIHPQAIIDYKTYTDLLSYEAGRDYGNGFDHYTSSSMITLRKLNNKIKGNLHQELFDFIPSSWDKQAKEIEKWLTKS